MPKPKPKPKAFAILVHTGLGAGHYDFLLEHSGGALAQTWQFSDAPSLLLPPPGGLGAAEKLEIIGRKIQGHRLMYLDYEGPVSNGRGQVQRLDGGTYEIISQADGLLVFALAGRTMKGIFALERTAGHWTLRACRMEQ